MNSEPARSFAVGDVRVALWISPILPAKVQVIIERRRPMGSRGVEYTGVLEAEDIPKAMLALKRAHDYLKGRRVDEAPTFESAATMEERIP